MTRTRTILIHLLLLTIVIANTSLSLMQILDRHRSITRRLEISRENLSTVEQQITRLTENQEDDRTLPVTLTASTVLNSEISDLDFSRSVEQLLTDNHLKIISFSPGIGEDEVLFDAEGLVVSRGQSIQVQIRGSATSFLRMLEEVHTRSPWIRIERLNYRPMSAESENEIQAELLYSFVWARYPDTSPYAELFSGNSENVPLVTLSTTSELRSILYLPPKVPADAMHTSPATAGSAGGSSTKEVDDQMTRDFIYLGSVKENGIDKFSLKHVETGTIIILGVGSSWQDWTLIDATKERLYFDYNGEKWYMDR